MVSSTEGWFEQLDGVAGRIVKEDLLSSAPGYDLIAKPATCTLQLIDSRHQVFDFDLDSVPTAGGGRSAVGHYLSSPASTRAVEQQL